MSGLLASLPLHLACQLMTPGDNSFENCTLEDTQLPQQNVAIPDGYTVFADVGVAYKYYSQNLTWDLARKHCISDGGNLAVLDSYKKLKYSQNTSVTKGDTRGPFVGIHKLFNNEEWVSAKTGLPLPFIPWKADETFDHSAPSCTASWGTNGIGPYGCNNRWAHLCEIHIFNQALETSTTAPYSVKCEVPVLEQASGTSTTASDSHLVRLSSN